MSSASKRKRSTFPIGCGEYIAQEEGELLNSRQHIQRGAKDKVYAARLASRETPPCAANDTRVEGEGGGQSDTYFEPGIENPLESRHIPNQAVLRSGATPRRSSEASSMSATSDHDRDTATDPSSQAGVGEDDRKILLDVSNSFPSETSNASGEDKGTKVQHGSICWPFSGPATQDSMSLKHPNSSGEQWSKTKCSTPNKSCKTSEWSCRMCTLSNSNRRKRCQVCGAPRLSLSPDGYSLILDNPPSSSQKPIDLLENPPCKASAAYTAASFPFVSGATTDFTQVISTPISTRSKHKLRMAPLSQCPSQSSPKLSPPQLPDRTENQATRKPPLSQLNTQPENNDQQQRQQSSELKNWIRKRRHAKRVKSRKKAKTPRAIDENLLISPDIHKQKSRYIASVEERTAVKVRVLVNGNLLFEGKELKAVVCPDILSKEHLSNQPETAQVPKKEDSSETPCLKSSSPLCTTPICTSSPCPSCDTNLLSVRVLINGNYVTNTSTEDQSLMAEIPETISLACADTYKRKADAVRFPFAVPTTVLSSSVSPKMKIDSPSVTDQSIGKNDAADTSTPKPDETMIRLKILIGGRHFPVTKELMARVPTSYFPSKRPSSMVLLRSPEKVSNSVATIEIPSLNLSPSSVAPREVKSVNNGSTLAEVATNQQPTQFPDIKCVDEMSGNNLFSSGDCSSVSAETVSSAPMLPDTPITSPTCKRKNNRSEVSSNGDDNQDESVSRCNNVDNNYVKRPESPTEPGSSQVPSPTCKRKNNHSEVSSNGAKNCGDDNQDENISRCDNVDNNYVKRPEWPTEPGSSQIPSSTLTTGKTPNYCDNEIESQILNDSSRVTFDCNNSAHMDNECNKSCESRAHAQDNGCGDIIHRHRDNAASDQEKNDEAEISSECDRKSSSAAIDRSNQSSKELSPIIGGGAGTYDSGIGSYHDELSSELRGDVNSGFGGKEQPAKSNAHNGNNKENVLGSKTPIHGEELLEGLKNQQNQQHSNSVPLNNDIASLTQDSSLLCSLFTPLTQQVSEFDYYSQSIHMFSPRISHDIIPKSLPKPPAQPIGQSADTCLYSRKCRAMSKNDVEGSLSLGLAPKTISIDSAEKNKNLSSRDTLNTKFSTSPEKRQNTIFTPLNDEQKKVPQKRSGHESINNSKNGLFQDQKCLTSKRQLCIRPCLNGANSVLAREKSNLIADIKEPNGMSMFTQHTVDDDNKQHHKSKRILQQPKQGLKESPTSTKKITTFWY